jgi:hypothetical protein
MVIARQAPSFVLIVALAAGCGSAAARGCSAGCRAGSRTAARSSSHAFDDVGRQLARSQPGRYVKPPVPARLGGQVGHAADVGQVGRLGEGVIAGERAAISGLDDAVAALPPIEGPASSLAKVPSPRGPAMTSTTSSAGTRSLANDYARAIDPIRVTRKQHELLLDAFDVAQAALDVVTTSGGDSPDPAAREQAERYRIQVIARVMEDEISQVLDAGQARKLYATLGTPQVIVYRLSRERPMKRAASAGSAAR